MGRITDNAAKNFRKKQNIPIPEFYVWAQYVALALIPIVILSYFVTQKPTGQVSDRNIYTTTTNNYGSNASSESAQDTVSTDSGEKITVKNYKGEPVEIPLDLAEQTKLIAIAYYSGDWSKVFVSGTAPSFSSVYPKAKLSKLIVYNLGTNSAVLGASIDKDGNGSADESIQFTLVVDDGHWAYQNNN